MATDSGPEKDPFLDRLRARVDGAEQMPSPQVWSALSQRLPVPNPWLTRYVGTGSGLGLVLGVLVGWLLRPAGLAPAEQALYSPAPVVVTAPAGSTAPPAATRAVVPSPSATPAVVPPLAGAPRVVIRTRVVRVPVRVEVPVSVPTVTSGPAASPATPAAGGQAAPTVRAQPLATLWASAVSLDSAIQQENTPVAGETAETRAARRTRAVALASAQQPVLLALQNQLHQLEANTRAALTETPPALAADSAQQPAATPPLVATDSSHARTTLAPPTRWAALLVLETSAGWGSLSGYNSLTTQEKILGATTRAAQLEYRAGARWRMRAGFGETQLRDQFRFMHDSLHHSAHHDTTWASHPTVSTVRDSTYTLQMDSVGFPSPIINAQGQVIGYHTVYSYFQDTVYHVTTRSDTTRQMAVHVREEFRNERRQQDLRPNYKFWTLPLAAQFDIISRPRWSAGVSVGGQLLFFRGGYQPVRDRATGTYALRRIGATEGPFRPVSLALMTGLDLRFRLTNRLSLMAGGSVRGWAVGPLRSGTLPRWTLAVQTGLSWELGR